MNQLGVRWTADQVLALAPDDASRKAGSRLGTAGPWSETGSSGSGAAWGLCKGSGGKPYRTVVDMAGSSPAYKCSCPSRKFPCKHALGLLLLQAADERGLQAAASGAAAPDWAQKWLAARRESAAGKRGQERWEWGVEGGPEGELGSSGTTVDPEAARRRAERRAERISAGATELDQRLTDLLRGGLATAEQTGYQLWEETAAERVGLLASVRAREPGAALTLLTATWPTERAEDRLMFLDSLRTGLSDSDEPFLEQALSDRSRNVRSTAAELLSALPRSALASRMASRATTCVSLDRSDRTGDGERITVEAPHECDADMQRDGISPKPPAGRGERSWWLSQLVECTPLAAWTRRLGGRTAREIVALPVSDDWQEELQAAWCRAAVRQQDADWSRALLGTPSAPPTSGPGTSSLAERSNLLATLPDGERADWVAEFIAAHGLSEAFQLLGVCTVPWAAPLGRSVVDALDIAREAGSYPWSFSGVMGLAERCLHPGEASRLEILTTTPDEQEDASPGAGGYWSEAFQRLVGTLRLRAAMLTELSQPEAPPSASHTAQLPEPTERPERPGSPEASGSPEPPDRPKE
ncbi:DUF5691 domain-containing protein [Streptomyces sp. H27-C3]|uniref:DUF5691 domain-containing protein n=1 Tax=Streptomyces sp. H27-C3 TaxID=3046305 RepID=UPI0024BA9373|nr:DUF5691 domain-containing protein [Streptomyces sp. H27-C3]MDJ0464028.1 DUF5691 domain-containing protein [Streptomyces sp. H27-C3]